VEPAELSALLEEVRNRVRARHPDGGGGMALPDLMPLVHARDAAQAKVAAIGTVNPRSGGPLNALVQGGKRLIARLLDWHVREQVEFNRNVVACVESTLEALDGMNRALRDLGIDSHEMRDLRGHWAAWRQEWERKLAVNETQFLRSVADLQGASQHRTTLMESNLRELMRSQHADFTGALERSAAEVQKRLWADLEKIRLEYERLIHSELRMVRQRAATAAAAPAAVPASPPAPSPAPPFDYARFAERFRGSADYVRAGQRFYLPFFAGRGDVLDIGCGRGEFLELMREAGIGARGIDLSAESVALCRANGLRAESADIFEYLAGLPEASLDGIFCAQVVEHLPPERLPDLLRLCASRLARGGRIAIETPNPECLAIFAVHFYLDPTHTRPVPHALLAFYMEEFGFGAIQVHKLSPAVESMPALASLPEDFRNAFFGGLDYAILGTKL
jgi:O-antigen chain-terminating methyltransferase